MTAVVKLNIYRLQLFIAVAESGGFSKAARNLAIVQSAVSRQIQLLEAEVGLILFRRNGRGVLLTDHGEVVLKRSKKIVSLIDDFRADLEQLAGPPSGLVSVAFQPPLGTFLLSPLLRTLEEAHPLIHVQLTEGLPAHVNELLETCAVDLALMYDFPRSGVFSIDHLFDEEMFLVGPIGADAAGDVSIAELSSLPLILPTGTDRISLDEAAILMDISLNVKFEIDSIVTTQAMVRDGLGYAIQSSAALYCATRRCELSIRRFEGAYFRRSVVLAYGSDRRPSQAAITVAAAIKTTFEYLLKCGYWRDHG